MDKQKIDEWFNSEEGKQSIEKFALKIQKKKENLIKGGKLKIKNFYLKKEDMFEYYIDCLLEFDDKVSDKLYKKYIDGQSNIIWLVFRALKEFGTPFKDTDFGMFTSDGYFLKGFKFEVISGQGSFVKIERI